MDGFKDTTRMKMGHAVSSSACPSYAKGPRNVFATGGIVAPYKTPGRGAPSAPRPVLPRPHVMPQMKSAHMPRTVAKLARGGKVMNGSADGGGGPYNGSPQGNSLEKSNRPYSEIEVQHPRNDARPGYARGGKKSPFAKKKAKSGKCEGGRAVGYAEGGQVAAIADREIRKHVAAPRPSGHGVKGGNLAFMSKPLFGK